jgi:hypothetical protein
MEESLKKYIDDNLPNPDDYVKKAGDEMAGPLILSRDPEEDMEAATKQYVDGNLGGAAFAINKTVLKTLEEIDNAPLTGIFQFSLTVPEAIYSPMPNTTYMQQPAGIDLTAGLIFCYSTTTSREDPEEEEDDFSIQRITYSAGSQIGPTQGEGPIAMSFNTYTIRRSSEDRGKTWSAWG